MASVAEIDGLTIASTPAFTGLLDTYTGAAAAYSVRRLYGQYTGAAMRIRRDSDDTETNIGFDSNGDLDTAAIATFVGSGNNGYVTKWYGQESSGGTGSGNDAAQTTNTDQPQIYNGTAVVTENGAPAVDYTGGQYLQTSNFSGPSTYTNFLVATPDDSTTNKTPVQVASSTISSGTDALIRFSDAAVYRIYAAGFVDDGSYAADTQYLAYSLFDTSCELALNGDTATTGTLNMTNAAVEVISIGAKVAGQIPMDGTIQEFVIFSGDQSSNRTGIESDINTYFSIY